MARKTGSHSEITGPAVRAAALRLFARSGYAAVSMREIASEVGVRAGALYLYTPDKQTLLFDLLREHMEQALIACEHAMTVGTPFERLEGFVRFHIGYHFDRRDVIFLAYMELRNLTEENFVAIEALRRTYEAHVEKILSDGHASGDFDVPDVRVTAMALITMLNGVNTWYREGGRLDRESVERVHWQLVRGMIAK